MNELTVFNNEEFGELKIIMVNNQPYFAGKELVESLGYNTKTVSYSKYIKRFCDEEDYIFYDKTKSKNDDYKFLGQRGGYLVNGTGALSLIVKSQILSKNEKQSLIKTLDLDDALILPSRKEINFLDKLGQALMPFRLTGIKQCKVLQYRIDYYIPTVNVAIEYDENDHKHYSYDAHEGRQKEIENELSCRFIRVSDANSDEYNIGYVIKNIFNYNIY